ncbi:MAG: SUMF1/EgtB/PvdO family nonheme iron enzyme, partial [Lentisphaeria bacterium]|nr:SUMF1/EgtB/PvdO family nonheme iron enzyme [Lentisphaeria bacterium]
MADSRMRSVPVLVSLACGLVLAAAGAGEAVLHTEQWANTDDAFAEFAGVVEESQIRNLLSRKGVQFHDGQSVGDVSALADGAAGVRGGDGRVGLGGQPSVITCYLGRATPIHRVGFHTFNIDARANQDYEVRFADNSAAPGKRPGFSEDAALTVGEHVIGPDSGGFHSWFARDDGQPIVAAADWVQFRIWCTYNLKAGHPARSGRAEGWTAGIELEVFGGPEDVLVLSPEQKARREALRRAPREPAFERRASWQETMQAAREEIVRWETMLDVLQVGDGGVSFGAWHVIGPLGDAAEITLIDRLREIDLGAEYGEQKRRWRPMSELKDGEICDVAALAAAAPGQTLFLARPITVEQPFDWRNPFCVSVGLADGWLMVTPPRQGVGGKQRPVHPNQYLLRLGLGPGDYVLFSRLTVQPDGTAPLCVTPHCAKGRPSAGSLDARLRRRQGLMGRLRREFADPCSLVQMDWETMDSVWLAFRRHAMSRIEYFLTDWAPGHPEAIAQRYGEATGLRREALRGELGGYEAAIVARVSPWLAALPEVAVAADTPAPLALTQARARYYDLCTVQEAAREAHRIESIGLAVADQQRTFGGDYPKGEQYARTVAAHRERMDALWPRLLARPGETLPELMSLREDVGRDAQEILLGNPVLRFDSLLMARGGPWFNANWSGPNNLGSELVALSPVRPDGDVRVIHKGSRISDFDLHFGGERILFSDGRFLQEVHVDGSGLRRISRQDDEHVQHFDGCYLPNEQILFVSTACEQAVPCTGQWYVGNMHLMAPDGTGERRLAFDQDHNWNPCVLHDGRVIYTRWEYTDTPHYFSRLLFRMNPDGSGQMEYYGSNSYWPNAMYWPRPIPGHPTQVVCIVSGHHGVSREGELVLLDPALGRHEADGVIQKIPGRGRPVEAVIADGLVSEVWPRFAAPYPLAEPGSNRGAGKYFLVNCRERPWLSWGIYLVDVFDNLTPLLLGPYCQATPLRPRPRPPEVPPRVDLKKTTGCVYMTDVYRGPGIAGCERGTIKALRLGVHHYRYGGNGDTYASSLDGGWDVKRILGTVPVHADGSAFFEVPANLPIFVQPLDDEGKALQTMRSWFTVMPGETLACVGCHEPQNAGVPAVYNRAGQSAPAPLRPWHGPARGFGFDQEVQPVLDRRCAGCHNGEPRPDGRAIPDLRAKSLHPGYDGRYSPSYRALHPYVRRAGFESDYHMLRPGEFQADTSVLVQMLKKGHHGVELSREDWERLYTWIDFNVPYAPNWRQSHQPPSDEQVARRAKYKRLHANLDDRDEEVLPAPPVAAFLPPSGPEGPPPSPPAPEGWPLTAEGAAALQAAAGQAPLELDLGEGITLACVPVPAGRFLAGDAGGAPDENRVREAAVTRPFYIGRFEVTNEQYARFDPEHDSAYIDARNKDRYTRGYPVNGPRQPVVRVSWDRAHAFCAWLSARTGLPCGLPTEVEWEWSCR